MRLYAVAPYESLGAALAEHAPLRGARCAVARFPNGELHATVELPEEERVCVLLGPVAPPDEHLLSTLLVAHTLKNAGAATIRALLPYVGYARQDRAETGQSLAAAWIGQLLHAVGIAEAVTIDVHSRRAQALFPIPLRSLSPAGLFAPALAALGWDDPTVVGAEAGARERCEAVRRAAGVERPLAHLAKTRAPDGVRHSTLEGTVSRRAIVVDDILDTGGTLVSACEGLVRAGVEDIVVMVTHGLFTGSAWDRLWSLRVRQIYCTDTVRLPEGVSGRAITVLPCAAVLAQWVRAAEEIAPERDGRMP
jgi:ribose-phosphate pyrophosphokinase